MKRMVTIKTSFEGVHCWPEAPEEVSHLRSMHRHMFNIEAVMEVEHDDREVEFIMAKHVINHWLSLQYDDNGVWQMGRLSCEQVAEFVVDLLHEKYGKDRRCSVMVSEDGENGAVVCDPEMVPGGTISSDQIKSGKYHLSLNDYQRWSYMAIQSHENNKEEVMHWAIGLGEEAGEALSVLKHKYYGGHYDVEDIVNELGDTLWHIAALCTALGISMEDVAAYNLEKLKHRYPGGKFDEQRSINRHKLNFRETPQAREIIEAVKATQSEAGNSIG